LVVSRCYTSENVNNTVEQVVCTFIDITGRKEAELEEKGNEIRLI
jgi:hypothetical protein